MKTAPLLSRLAELEAKIDPILFREKKYDANGNLIEEVSANAHKTWPGAAAAAGLGVGGYLGHTAIRDAGGYQAVGTRMAGAVGGAAAGAKAGVKAGLANRAAAAAAGASAGRTTGLKVATDAGALIDKGVIAGRSAATTGIAAVKSGVKAVKPAIGVAKTTALDLLKKLKGALPTKRFDVILPRLVELEAKLTPAK